MDSSKAEPVTSPPTPSDFRDISILLQKFYLMRRMLRSQYEAGKLRISEAQALFQVYIEPGISASRLKAVLHLDKSSISRLLKNLAKKGLLVSEQCTVDHRIHMIQLTDQGIAFVRQIQESNNKILAECLVSLNAKEQYELGHLLNILADGLKCSDASYLPGDHPVTLAIVRLGRGTGMTGNSFMSTIYTSTQYHVLSIIAENNYLTFTAVSEKLPLHKSHISRALKELRERALVAYEAHCDSSSKGVLSLTPEGICALDEINLAGEKVIESGLKNQNGNIALRLKTLLSTLIAPTDAASEAKILQKRIEVKKITSIADRKVARGMLIEHLVKTNSHFDAPDDLYSPDNILFGLYIEDSMVAACERIQDGAGKKITNQVQLPQIDSDTIDLFLEKVNELTKIEA